MSARSLVKDALPARLAEPFWRLWAANVLSNLGDGIYQFALPVLAIGATRSPVLVSSVTVTLTAAWPLFGLHAGAIVDRSDRRRVLVAVNRLRAVVLAMLTASFATDVLTLPALYVAAAALGVGETLADTAITSLVPAVVARDRLDWANGRIVAGQTVTNSFVGPPLAGALVGIAATAATSTAMGLYTVALGALGLLRGTYRREPAADGDRSRVTDGIRFLWRDRVVRPLTLFTAAMNLWWAAFTALIALYAVAPGPMGLSPFGYGVVLTAMAVGGIVGSLAAERIHRAIGARNALLLDLVGTVALLGAPAVTTNAVAVGAAVALAGAGAGVWVVLVASIRQRRVPDALLGRVYGASRLVSWGVLPVGAALGGMAAELVGIRPVFAVGAIVSVALVALFVAVLPSKALEKG